MAKCYYNGVLLPEIPANVLADYPYAFIFKESTKYHTIFSKTAYWYQSRDDTVRNSEGGVLNYLITYDEVDSGLDWYFRNDGWYYWAKATSGVLWSNYDILQVTDSKPSLWFAATEPVPEVLEDVNWYQIKASTLEDFGDEARRIIEDDAAKTPAEMLSIFKQAKIPKLQGKLVTENGDYTPDNEYDGFSKVTVNVPTSGGGSVTPGEGETLALYNHDYYTILYEGILLPNKEYIYGTYEIL